ncbi:MAG: putative sugar uptake transporter permease protein [Deltaproteobacteria bacterium]|jgi:multiple sugar transport system permease protein|nr:putative sugar uptake transporter permease protein [Deltaproteobacteria bacterium]MBP1719002.1 putative sugar uptake transporter permease protein [Deltaproteobacteria bacterium]
MPRFLANKTRSAAARFGGYLFIGPAFLWLLLIIGVPFFLSVYLSATNSLAGKWGSFIGLDNYLKLLDSQIFRRTLQNSLIFTAGSIALKTILGTALALLLNEKLRARNFFRGAILLPWIAPASLSTLAWLWIFNPIYGVANQLLKGVGLLSADIPWLSTSGWALFSVILVNTWRGTPFFVISILAGLSSVPQELYEAARVDGANAWKRFLHVTLPMIQPILLIVILFSTIMTFSDFQIVYILTNGGPANSTHLFATLSYQTGMIGGNIGEGAAILLFMAPFLALLIYLQLRLRGGEA